MRSVLLLAMILVGCGMDEQKQVIDERLKPMVLEFAADFGHVSSSVVVGPLNNGSLATCFDYKGSRTVYGEKAVNKVIFDEKYFDGLSPIMKKAIIFHELGHCQLNLEHSAEGDYTLTDPYIYTTESDYYESNWSALVADLKFKAGRY